MKPYRVLFLAGLLALFFSLNHAQAASPPPSEQNLKLKAPIANWDEGIPLGNGLTGGLLFGGDNMFILGLDRGDLWDERVAPGVDKEWWKKSPWHGKPHASWERAYTGASPTKLPGGRVHITLPESEKLTEFGLDYATAEGWAKTATGASLRGFFSATAPVALVKVSGAIPQSIDVLSPLDVARHNQAGRAAGHSPGSVNRLGYPEAEKGKDGNSRWYLQQANDGFAYCVVVDTRRIGDDTLVAIAVTTTRDHADPVTLGRQRCQTALNEGYVAALKPHVQWWHDFWAQSSVEIPQADIQQQYTFVRYLYGAGSRRGAPPLPLQGVWTANNGNLPPWKGDYHNDLNTQMTYIAYFGSGDYESGASFLDYLWNLRDTFRDFARDFYGTDGLSVPGVMSLAGQPLGGWPQYSLSPTNTAWNAHQFYLHWRYTMDDTFLRERAYPWCAEAGQCLAALLKPDEDGVLKLLRSSSPEIHNNSARAWMKPNTNYDNMCLRMFFLALQEMADACGKPDEAKKWRGLADGLGPWHVNSNSVLKLNSVEDLKESHRHLSNLMGLYPFNLITVESGVEDQKIIRASLQDWERFRTGAWVGYTFSWMSCLRARMGDAESALRHLDIYTKAFVLRNGFHVNGDQSRSGFSGFTYRPFTLEGNFLAMQAVHEMFLQSWSATPGTRDTEVIRIFPAMPWRWHQARFEDLRTEGAHRVSATWENNATTSFKIVAGKDGVVRIRDNFGGRTLRWNRGGVVRQGETFAVSLKKDEILEATLEKPASVPPPPENLAEPVVIGGLAATTLPLRLGADNQGNNRFRGDIAQASVFDRVLTAEEIAVLATSQAKSSSDAVLVFDTASQVKTMGGVSRRAIEGGPVSSAFHFDGTGYLEVPSSARLNGRTGLTLAAWIRPDSVGASMRIFDKSFVGQERGYLLDTHPNNSLRLRTRFSGYPAKLQAGTWVHVAGTYDPFKDEEVLYINGREVSRR